MGGGQSGCARQPGCERQPVVRKLIGLPCWHNKECYVTNRSPQCECTGRRQEEAMFVANNRKWIAAKFAATGVCENEIRCCFLRGPAWCREHCRDPHCMYCVTPERAEWLRKHGPPPRPVPKPPPCRQRGCRTGRRRADCACPDRPAKEARAAKYNYKHVCAGLCRVFCELRGPEWCREHCENPRCLFRAGHEDAPCCGFDAGPRLSGATRLGGVQCHWCPPCGWPAPPGQRAPCAIPVHMADHAAARNQAEDEAERSARQCAALARHKAEAAAGNPKAAAAAEKPKKKTAWAREMEGTAQTKAEARIARSADSVTDTKNATARIKFFDVAVQLNKSVRERILSLKCAKISDKSKRELQTCYMRVEKELLKILEKVITGEVGPELKHLDTQFANFEAITKKHDKLRKRTK